MSATENTVLDVAVLDAIIGGSKFSLNAALEYAARCAEIDAIRAEMAETVEVTATVAPLSGATIPARKAV